jgi:hypothetical protein
VRDRSRSRPNQSLEPTPFDCRSGQADWAGALSHINFMKQFSMLAKLNPAGGGSASSRSAAEATRGFFVHLS